jgi:hypothetical protein
MKKFIIKDWTGKICFHGQTFDSFEDAWGFLYEKYEHLKVGDDEKEYNEALGEYHVETEGE